MPNISEEEKENGSGNNGNTGKKPGKESPEASLHDPVKPYCMSDTSTASLVSRGDGHYPWGCPVTHTREKFYTICSDYAFLNRVTSICKSPSASVSACLSSSAALNVGNNTPSLLGVQTGASDIIYGEDANLEDLSGSLGKLPLAWEIDKSEFNSVTTNHKNKAGEVVDVGCCVRERIHFRACFWRGKVSSSHCLSAVGEPAHHFKQLAHQQRRE